MGRGGPNLLARVAHWWTGGALHWFAGGRTPLVAWVRLHEGVLVLKQHEELIWLKAQQLLSMAKLSPILHSVSDHASTEKRQKYLELSVAFIKLSLHSMRT